MEPTTVYHQSKREDSQIKQTRNKLNKLKQKNQRLLLDIKSVFPFKIFPSRIRVDEEKVVIDNHQFFGAKRIFPILIKDIRTVRVDKNFFLAALKFDLKLMETNPDEISHLNYSDAVKAQKLITGLIMCHNEGIDTSVMSVEEVVNQSQQLGQIAEA